MSVEHSTVREMRQQTTGLRRHFFQNIKLQKPSHRRAFAFGAQRDFRESISPPEFSSGGFFAIHQDQNLAFMLSL